MESGKMRTVVHRRLMISRFPARARAHVAFANPRTICRKRCPTDHDCVGREEGRHAERPVRAPSPRPDSSQ
jgi:hypothetical protein